MKPADAHDYRPDIDGLRAVAVLAVLFFHAGYKLFSNGHLGVDVFFVISGFLITSIILRGVEAGRFSFVEFYTRRIRRIFPALIVILAFCFAAGWFELWTREFRQLGKHIFAAVGFASNFVLWKETGYFDARAETKPLLHLWSLGIEEQFYLVWPLLVWGTYRLRRSVAPLIPVILLSSFALNVWWVTRSPGAAFFLPLPRFWELMVGSGLAYLALHRGLPEPGPRAELLSAAGLAAIGAAMLLLRRESAFPGWWALLPTVGAMLVIAAGPETRLNKHVLGQPAVVFIGLISYPLYLWHWPILTFLRMSRLEPLPMGLRLAAVGASIGLAWLTYRFVELPIRTSRPRRVAPALCGTLASVGMVGFALAWSNGLPSRFPKTLRKLDSYALMSDDVSREWRRHRCMLETESTFADECVESTPATAPLAVLWGDSHAAALYPGLHGLQPQSGFRLAQFSTRRCPPILDFVSPRVQLESPQCLDVNRDVVRRIAELRPSVVFMTAWWELYKPDLLERTLDTLRAVGVQRIVVVGDVPVWRSDVTRTLFRQYDADPARGVPLRVPLAHFRLQRSSDSTVAAAARAGGAEFVSLLNFLCNASTCMSYLPQGMAYSDGNHLSPPASRVVADSLFAGYFVGVGRATASR